jgi:AraC-like DNA-binding protein
MSPPRQHRPLTIEQEPFLTVRSIATGCSSGHVIETHRHDWHQLVYACAGSMTVHGGRSSWMIPPGKAVFIPAGCSHSIRMWGQVAVRSLYFPASLNAAALNFEQCRVLSVTPLLRELILRIIEWSALDSRTPSHNSLLHVLLDEMNVAPVAPLMLPLPADARAVAVARYVLACPTAAETIDDLSRRFGAGRRTLERLFSRETGLSFGLWRQKVRMLDSIRLLAEGKSVTETALDVGYASVSAFIAAFRQTFGYTPGRLGNGAG